MKDPFDPGAAGDRLAQCARDRSTTRPGMGRRYGFEGDARTGESLARAGGALVRAGSEDGRVRG